MVRRRAEIGLEASLSHNIGKHQIGESSIGAQGLVSHAQSVVEVPHGYSRGLVGSLISDNGGEYWRKEFDRYYSEHGICREKTIPRTPQENGVSERMNGIIMEHASYMRLHAGLPLQYLQML